MRFAGVAIALLCSLPAAAEDTLWYAMSRRHTDYRIVATTDILAADPRSGAANAVYSDRGQPIMLSVDNLGPVMTIAAGRLFAYAGERKYSGITKRGPADPFHAAVYELSTDGSHRYRRIFVPEGEQHIRQVFAVNRSATRLAYVNITRSIPTAKEPSHRVFVFVHDTADGTLLNKIDLSAVCTDCTPFFMRWLDDEQLLFQFEPGPDGLVDDPASRSKAGIYVMRADGANLKRWRETIDLAFPEQGSHRRFPRDVHPWPGGLLMATVSHQPQPGQPLIAELFVTDDSLHTRKPIPLEHDSETAAFRPSASGEWIAFERFVTLRTSKPPWPALDEIWVKHARSGAEARIAATAARSDTGRDRLTLIGWSATAP